MSRQIKRQLLGIAGGLFGLAIASSASATPITPAFEWASATFANAGNFFTLGQKFTLSSAVTVNALGYIDDGLFPLNQVTQQFVHPVGIWDSSNVLVATANVVSTDPLIGHYYWSSIPDVSLAVGTYTIGAQILGVGGYFPYTNNTSGFFSIPEYMYITDEQVIGAGLNQPYVSLGNGSYGPYAFVTANFSVASVSRQVPEPFTLSIFGIGVAGAYVMRRRSAKAQSFRLA